MVPRSAPLSKQDMLHRPRLDTLIRKGLSHPLIVFLAGIGYGKTEAMAGFAARSKQNLIWFQLSKLDSTPSYFWNHITRGLAASSPDLAAELDELGFPDSVTRFDEFARRLVNHIAGAGETMWVFDDFGEVSDKTVSTFFEMLATLELTHFRFVLMSSILTSRDSVAFMSNRRFLILTDDLRFTRQEIFELFGLHGIALGTEELDAIERYTEGWPLAVHLLAENYDGSQMSDFSSQRLPGGTISDIFEEHFFYSYTKHQQQLLVQLSMLDFFTRGFMVHLYKGNPDDFGVFKDNEFIKEEHSTGHFFFHNIYRIFLNGQRHLLDEHDLRQVWREAAEYCEEAGYTTEAVAYYHKCGNHSAMIGAILKYFRTENCITERNAPFFCEHLDYLTPAEERTHPAAKYLRAMICFNLLEFDRAEELLTSLERELSGGTDRGDIALLGEAYSLHGNIRLMRSREDFGAYFQKALKCLPDGSVFFRHKGLSVRDNHVFTLPDNAPGAKERMERAVHDGMVPAQRFMHGSMSGRGHLFSAEAAYLSFEPEAAMQHAYRAVYKARAGAQHDLVCNAYGLLARTCLLMGDLDGTCLHMDNLTQHAEKHFSEELAEIRDTSLGWFYIKTRDYRKVPEGLFTSADTAKPLWAYGRSQLVCANYLLHTGEYARLIGMLEYPKGPALTQGISFERILLFILLAVSYYRLGEMDAAIRSLRTAYDMCAANGLITPFIEAEGHMLALIELVRGTDPNDMYGFPPEWLELIHDQTRAYIRRVSSLRAAFRRRNPVSAAKTGPLSRRELEVLQAIARGMTQEEVAISQFVSVNTVKSTIRSIYNKLDANNKADAVSIALTRGYIDGHRRGRDIDVLGR